jgi:hypothetical protein
MRTRRHHNNHGSPGAKLGFTFLAVEKIKSRLGLPVEDSAEKQMIEIKYGSRRKQHRGNDNA